MSARSVGFVGGGRVARILLGGWKRAGLSLPDVVVSDVDANALAVLRSEFPSIAATHDNQQAAAQEVVLFALHPPAFPAGLAAVKPALKPGSLFISLAPRWTMGRIREALGGFSRLARVIPNAPSLVNQGYNPVSFSESLPADARAEVQSLFDPLGVFPEVPEDTLEAYAIVAAMGPTYLWYQLYQLIDLGCEFGLTREAATRAVGAMVAGAATTVTESGMTPPGVMDLIPVKPLASIEATVTAAYGSLLGDLHRKLKG